MTKDKKAESTGKFRPFQLSIRNRLIFLFTLQIVLMLLVGGFYLNWRLQRTLDTELADKLKSLAQAAALQIDADLLAGLAPGDEQTRTYRNLSAQLSSFKASTGVRRLYVFTRAQSSILDTRPATPIGAAYAFIPLAPTEMQALFAGHAVSSTLFTGSDKRLYKAGFASIFSDGIVVAALAVEGSAHTLEAIKAVRRDLLALGLFMLIGSVLLGIFFSERITTSINRLKEAAAAIGQGDYETPIELLQRDEIGFLANTMEEMRRAIVHRDIRQKTMIAGVAHEIRNPLGGIELFAGLLAGELTEEKAKSEAQKIQKEVQNLKKIVADFLDYARPQNAQRAMCEVGEIYHEVISLLAVALDATDCQITEKEAGTQIYVDPLHFKQVLLNLLKNAAEAAADNGKIELTVENVSGSVKLKLSDNGPGFSKEARQRLFEPFFTTRPQGTGLGLAIVKSLVDENGGEIFLKPQEAGGAVFELTFPAKPISNSSGAE